jgi:hypothetical protein
MIRIRYYPGFLKPQQLWIGNRGGRRRFPLLGAITPAGLNAIIGGSRNATPVVTNFPACVCVGPRLSGLRSGVNGVRRRGGAVQAELNARCR